MLKTLLAFKKWYTAIIVGICTVVCFVILGMNVVQVIMRYVIDKAFTYTEDITILGMLWIMALGVSLGSLNHEHLLINVIDGCLSPKALEILIWVEDILLIFAGVAMTWLGYLALEMNRGFTQSMMGFDESFRYVPVVVGGVLTAIVSIVNVLMKVCEWKEAGTK